MMFWTSSSLFAAGLAGLIALYVRRYECDFQSRITHLLGLVSLGTLGIACILFGISLYSKSGAINQTFATFTALTGAQTLLWSLGIRLDFLGNQSTETMVTSPPWAMSPDYPHHGYDFLRHALELTDRIVRGGLSAADVSTGDLMELAERSRFCRSADVVSLVKDVLVCIERIRLSAAIDDSASHRTRRDAIESLAELRVALMLAIHR